MNEEEDEHNNKNTRKKDTVNAIQCRDQCSNQPQRFFPYSPSGVGSMMISLVVTVLSG